ncbi:Xylose isomerase domain-containing protein TIM barrel [Ruminiclostridium papyrosolvens DSM 2782]|uniref:Xylose isomerase domain-containing protein TIM barrel n=1 Tax=Ruminiclostridium papyrosolvens DSM 2782 TaxID=588581 RepID=F1TAL1_9FIRM|nr:TIM barrel protein [Ruminiclostridium papyrosolvens]EGD48554.1 Xylose isomerase domain-containing protein TIM barrel [Ruminiclostridium papyrosolvens DSM 2782]WES32690.1 TIM barrel protein [Ruminiclostridium papyrosolvens DSM 2782]
MIRFGPSGNSDSFYEQGFKSSSQMPAWLASKGLNAYEYSCTKGVKVGEATAREIGQQAQNNNIFVSIHAPYYINMSSEEEDKRENSKRYIMETLQVAKWMGAKRIVVHTGSTSKLGREKSLELAIQILKETLQMSDAAGFGDISICPEVLGKHNQLGTLEEIMEMCKIDERLIPTIDFGHVHARGLGILNSQEDFETVIDFIENSIGKERTKNIHCHFSRIEFSKGGEKKHWNFSDKEFGPEFKHLAPVLVNRKMEPVIICESRGMMAEDAAEMKEIYYGILENQNLF